MHVQPLACPQGVVWDGPTPASAKEFDKERLSVVPHENVPVLHALARTTP